MLADTVPGWRYRISPLAVLAAGLVSACDPSPPVAAPASAHPITGASAPPAVTSSATPPPPPPTASASAAAPLASPPEEPWRVAISSDLKGAAVMRLERPRGLWDGAAPPSPSILAGFAIRKGSERPLSAAEVARLGTWLTAPAGFDDLVAKRCAMENLVGFRLTRGGESGEEQVEVAVDFNCQKIFAVRGAGARRKVHGSHFDASRAEILDLVKKALPADTEVQKIP